MNRKTTAKQAKAIKYVRHGMSARQAMIKAGYSRHTADNPGTHLWGLEGTKQYLADLQTQHLENGNTPARLAQKTAELLDAKKPNGLPDYPIQLKAGEMIRRDFGMWEPKNLVQVQQSSSQNYNFDSKLAERVSKAVNRYLDVQTLDQLS